MEIIPEVYQLPRALGAFDNRSNLWLHTKLGELTGRTLSVITH